MGAGRFGAVVASRDTGGRGGGGPFRRSIDSRRECQALCLKYLNRETTWFEGRVGCGGDGIRRRLRGRNGGRRGRLVTRGNSSGGLAGAGNRATRPLRGRVADSRSGGHRGGQGGAERRLLELYPPKIRVSGRATGGG